MAQKEINLLSDQYNDKYRALQLSQDRLNMLQTNADRKYQVATQQAQLDMQQRSEMMQQL
jgi:hypothetical protein